MRAFATAAELARFLRFACVGMAGFLADAGLLAALHNGAGIDPFSARLVSITAGALVTWRLNRALTFGASGASQATEGLRYAAVATISAGVNYAIYALTLALSPGLPPVVAVIGATLAGMMFSYAGYSRYVFHGAAPTVLSSPRSQSR